MTSWGLVQVVQLETNIYMNIGKFNITYVASGNLETNHVALKYNHISHRHLSANQKAASPEIRMYVDMTALMSTKHRSPFVLCEPIHLGRQSSGRQGERERKRGGGGMGER